MSRGKLKAVIDLMPKGYRLLVISFAGLILCGSIAPQKQRLCGQGVGNDHSELCAEWKSANAAQEAADYAYYQLGLSIVGIAGLIITLGFNFGAWRQAKDAQVETRQALEHARISADAATKLVEISDRNARKELRAYLDFDDVVLERYSNSEDTDLQLIRCRITVKIVNYGKTPAENVDVEAAWNAIGVDKETAGMMKPIMPSARTMIHSIAPLDHFNKRIFTDMPDEILKVFEADQVRMHCSVITTYTDVFGERHVLRSEFESVGGVGEPWSMIEGTRSST